MAFVPVANTVLCLVNMRSANEPAQNTLWFKSATAVGLANVTVLANALRDKWLADFLPLMPTAVEFISVEAVNQTTNPGETFTSFPATPSFGTISGDTMSNQVTLAVSFRTGFTGRANRGRNFWPLFAKSQVTNNLVSSLATDDIVSAYSTLVGAGAVADDFEWCIAHRYVGKNPMPAGTTRPVVAVGVTDRVVDTMKSRLPGHGQ